MVSTAGTCGLGSWRPQWLQVLASPKFLMLNLSLIAITQGSYFTYLIGATSTLEKRFAYDSKLTGFILIADNLSQLVINPVIGYLGTRMNKAKLMAAGMFFVSFSCWLTAVPYYIYGANELATGLIFSNASSNLSSHDQSEYCSQDGRSQESCGVGGKGEHNTVWLAYTFIWMASFLNGVGYTAFYTLGLPFIDDNVSKRNAPLYFSGLSCIRLLGPAFGFVLSGFCLNLYEDPFNPPEFGPRDMRWIGCWWLGFIIIGALIFVTSLPLFLFPAQLKPKNVVPTALDKELANLTTAQDIKAALRRFAANKLLLFDTLSRVMAYLGYGGYYITQPKYIESQYLITASQSSFTSGKYTMMSMAGGLMTGGVLIWFFKPGPKALTIYITLAGLACSIGLFSGMFMGCPSSLFDSGSIGSISGQMSTNYGQISTCSQECACSRRVFQPVCSQRDQKTNYFSPCFAACSKHSNIGHYPNVTSFTDCDCEGGGEVTSGLCPVDCGNNFMYYIATVSLGKLVACTGMAGNVLVKLRSVDDRDKSFALGITKTVLALFGSIPYPLLFGYITDKACLLWESSCGQKGNCWFYDQAKFRRYLHVASFSFMLLSSCLDLLVIKYSYYLKNLYDDEEDGDEKKDETKL